jgi:hypothetical protein
MTALRSNLETAEYELALTRDELLAYRNSPRPEQRRLMNDIERAWHWLETGGHVVNRVELHGLHESELIPLLKHETTRVSALARHWQVWW